VHAAMSGERRYYSRRQRKRRSEERFPPFDYAQGAPSKVEGRLAAPEAERWARPAN